MRVRGKSQKGQVIIEYILLVAVGVFVIIGATKYFNKHVIETVSKGISERVGPECSRCK